MNSEDEHQQASQLHQYERQAVSNLLSHIPVHNTIGDSHGQDRENAKRFHAIPASVRTFWRRQISILVPHDACRDHFALERTFLGYLRTSLALSFLAVIIAQLFRLQQTDGSSQGLGYYTSGIPLACVCIVASIFVLLFGAVRFWRQQNAILRGKVLAGGWEINAVAISVFLVTLTILVLLVTLDAKKDGQL